MDVVNEILALKLSLSEVTRDLNRHKGLLFNMEGHIENLERENTELHAQNIDLLTAIDNIKTENKSLKIELKHINREVKDYKKRNNELRDKLLRKHSGNSSIPPSKDENRVRPNQSLRKKSARKSGGQKGHKGFTLEMQTATEVIEHVPKVCDNCGQPLLGPSIMIKRRQKIDIPTIVPDIIEHQQFSVSCGCGCISKGRFPKDVSCPVSYGPRIESLISYMNVRQYIPIRRMQEFLKQVYGVKLSEGTICNKLRSFSNKALPYYNWIHKQIENSAIVGSDETGCVIDGDKAWMWTWQSDLFTYISCSKNRGWDTIQTNFPRGFKHATLLSDCYRAQLKTQSKSHQLCTAHLLRELNYLIELKDKWSKLFKDQLCQSLELLKLLRKDPTGDHDALKNLINKKVDILLAKKLKGHRKVQTFQRRMIKNRQYLFRYLEDPSIPPDNNGSERAIRNVKVKQKVSGQFKSELGADYFAISRSVIDTFIKRRQPIVQSMIKIVS